LSQNAACLRCAELSAGVVQRGGSAFQQISRPRKRLHPGASGL
jgi:hypothetical protein